MNHKQVLDKLASKHLNQSIDEDLVRLVNRAMVLRKGKSISDVSSYILPKLLMRWNCILEAKEYDVSKVYKEKVTLALAILLHKYGFHDKELTQKAITAIDKLNDGVILSDDFFRKSDKIKAFIKAKPIELKRKPPLPETITFYRAKDVISINIDNKYYIAYIHKITGVNESPIIEFYDESFENIPEIEDLNRIKAKGQKFNDGTVRIAHFAIYGLKYMPDLANQIHVIKSCVETEKAPINKNLEAQIGLFTVSNLFSIQETIKKLFS